MWPSAGIKATMGLEKQMGQASFSAHTWKYSLAPQTSTGNTFDFKHNATKVFIGRGEEKEA